MPTIEANGQTLYYEEHGEGEPLLCVMGLAADTLTWALQVPAFSERHRTVIFDNRDVGQSSMADGPYEITDMAADALALADGLELDTFHLLGVSMGGAIAQEMALAAPGPGANAHAGGHLARRRRLGPPAEPRCGARACRSIRARSTSTSSCCSTSRRQFFENADAVAWLRGLMLENPHPQPPEAFARQLDASSRHDTRDRLGSLSMPVHVIGAEQDILVPVWKSRELA